MIQQAWKITIIIAIAKFLSQVPAKIMNRKIQLYGELR
jgi:hypothetical protein